MAWIERRAGDMIGSIETCASHPSEALAKLDALQNTWRSGGAAIAQTILTCTLATGFMAAPAPAVARATGALENLRGLRGGAVGTGQGRVPLTCS
jgi:hypothetical protein